MMREQARVMSCVGTGMRYVIVEREGRSLPVLDGLTGQVARFPNSDPELGNILRAMDNWSKMRVVG